MPEKEMKMMEYVSKGVGDFTPGFTKTIASDRKKNLICSALSAHLVLAMSSYGAKGKTAEEMRKVLGLPDNDNEVLQGFQDFISCLNNVSEVVLKLANKIFVSNTTELKDDYKKLTEKYFHSETELLNFSKSGESADIINRWCIDKTNGKIRSIISEQRINPDLAMVLVNAVYFLGNWKDQFNVEETRMRPFHIDADSIVNVPTMHLQSYFLYQEIKELDARSIILPYKNEDIVMRIILPNEVDGLEQLMQILESIQIDDISRNHDAREINLYLPKFKIESEIELNEHLKAMGMIEMFTDRANFSGKSVRSVKVSKVLQKAFIEVNEYGTEAAAVTEEDDVDMCTMWDEPTVLHADRPFYFNIYHSRLGVTLFEGAVYNPSRS